MCGITGFIESGSCNQSLEKIVRAMSDVLLHRGPDDGGAWVDESSGIAVAHRRLSILDLSPAGHQPMHSVCGRYVIVFNGEIYNHLEIRQQLEKENLQFAVCSPLGESLLPDDNSPSRQLAVSRDQSSITSSQSQFNWRGHSDTETLLAAFSAWGIEKTLKACVGMFAIALWDREEQMLTLARDHMGEKPLYYGWLADTFIFGSELKALKAHPDFIGDVDRGALTLLLRYNYIPTPYSIYQGIHKLPSGTFLQIQCGRDKLPITNHQSQPIPYWSLAEVAERGQAEPFAGNDDEAIDLLESTLGDAIKGQQLADVPLGAFLSGGIDSSVVAALMQEHSDRPIKTFTIGFDESDYNEAVHAKSVAKHLGTEHTELYLSPQDALDVIPQLPSLYDEPFADSSQIPTFLVAQMARQDVTVALSGDGGDELFGGYNRHTWSRTIRQKTGWVPTSVRQGIGSAMCSISPSAWDAFNSRCGSYLPSRFQTVQMGEKVHKLAGLLNAKDESDLYKRLVSQWFDPASVVIGAGQQSPVGSPPGESLLPDDNSPSWQNEGLLEIEHQMMLMDGLTYLPDDILCKVDRAAMGVSLETRVPMLDHRVVELAWALPLHMKIRNGQGKWLLRQLLYKHVPQLMMDRPKQGFGLPVDVWLRGPLRDWAEALLDESRLEQEGFFNAAVVRQVWQQHLSGENRQFKLWGVLMFQAWLEEQ